MVTSTSRALEAQGKGDVAKLILNAQHFEVDWDIFKAAARFVLELIREDEVFFDSIALPPAPVCTIRIGQENTLLLAMNEADRVEMIQLTTDGFAARRYAWRCGTNECDIQSYFEENGEETQFVQGGIGLTLPMMLTLINSPKLVEFSSNGKRQERRAAFRADRFAVDAWHKVTWKTAAGKVHQTDTRNGDSSSKSLHYRRGHLRTAQPHFTNAFTTKLTETGWGQWIDGRWVGDPSLGIKKAVHSPKLDQAGLAKFIKTQNKK